MKEQPRQNRKPNHAPCDHDHASIAMPATAALHGAARLFRAMGDVERLRLLELLKGGERCVSEIVAAAGVKFSTISQRLKILRDEGLIARRRDGTHLYYTLADQHVTDLIRNALAHADELSGGPTANPGE